MQAVDMVDESIMAVGRLYYRHAMHCTKRLNVGLIHAAQSLKRFQQAYLFDALESRVHVCTLDLITNHRVRMCVLCIFLARPVCFTVCTCSTRTHTYIRAGTGDVLSGCWLRRQISRRAEEDRGSTPGRPIIAGIYLPTRPAISIRRPSIGTPA